MSTPVDTIASAAIRIEELAVHEIEGLLDPALPAEERERRIRRLTPRARRNSRMSGSTCPGIGHERLMQLLVPALAQGIERCIVAANQAHELLRIHLVAMTAGVLIGHGRAAEILRTSLRGPALA